MLKAIQQYFDAHIQSQLATAEGGHSDHALHLATAALMIEMMRADFEEREEERTVVVELLQKLFSLGEDETKELLALAEQEMENSACLYEFTRLVDKYFSMEEKVVIIGMLWRVAFADANKDKYEEYLVRKIADLLHVTHSDYIRTRHKVEQELALQSD